MCSHSQLQYILIYSLFYIFDLCLNHHCRNYLFDGHQDNPNIATQPEDRPGGFDWGGREQGEEDD